MGVVLTREALNRAGNLGLDLVEISPNAKPPVCRIMDYGKFKYDKHKKDRAAKKNQTHTKLKEIKFHANVGEHDYQTKLRHAREFLEQGHRLKFSLYFRGRENAHHDLGFDVMNRCADELEDIGQIEQRARLQGRSLIMLVYPKILKK